MKVKVIHRDSDVYASLFKKAGSVHPYYVNPDPKLHPLENAREIQRAVVAAKLEKIFSKPLLGVLDGHRDAVKCITRCNTHLTDIFTGSCDGEVRHWDTTYRKCIRSIRAHEGFVQGLTISPDDMTVYSCGDDAMVKAWAFHSLAAIPHDHDLNDRGHLVKLDDDDTSAFTKPILPINIWNASGPLTSVDHHWCKPIFLTTGESVDIWDSQRSSPTSSFPWNDSVDMVCSACFNQADGNLLAASGGDNAVCLFDIRTAKCFGRVFLRRRTNSICWNPMQPLLLTCANEDSNLYTFDMRRLDTANVIHKDFTNAVLCVDYSPTGKEFVAGSVDKTLRIFSCNEGRSREIYHGKRMQMVLSCNYSADSRFIFSGSADFCVRIWKAKAWESLGPKSQRQKRALAYREALKERHKHVPEVRRILKHRHVPKLVKSEREKKRIMDEAHKRAEINRQLNSNQRSSMEIPEKKRPILKVDE